MTAPNPVQRRRLASDECAEEGAQPYRPEQPFTEPPPKVWPSLLAFLRGFVLLACGAILFAVIFFAAMKDARAAEVCDWSNPGTDRFTGDVPAAVDAYQDIPVETRVKLASRLEQRAFDEIVTITATDITGRYTYAPELWAMHYGTGRICMRVTRAQLQGPHYGLAYTEDGYTIIVPNDCGNVARATRLEQPAAPTAHALSAPLPGPSTQEIVYAPPESDPPLPPIIVNTPEIQQIAAYAYGPTYGPPTLLVWLPPVVLAPVPVPEPSTWLLMLAGALAIYLTLRLKRRGK